jgi:DNA modification methylase
MPEITLHHGDCIEVMRTQADASVDAVVTDPPYELNFMGREWDRRGIAYRVDLWAEVLRLLRPGGHLLAFGGTRTYHRLAVAIEDAGFAIEDSIHWIYGQGFPKHKSKLKPAHEPIVLATRPGGAKWLGVDACRVGTNGEVLSGGTGTNGKHEGWDRPWMHDGTPREGYRSILGRWPTNAVFSHHPDCNGVCVSGCAALELDAQGGERKVAPRGPRRGPMGYQGAEGYDDPEGVRGYGDSGGASRFFPTFAWGDDDKDDLRSFYYCGKATRRDRNEGCEGLPKRSSGVHDDDEYRRPGERKADHTAPFPRENHHPTIKPTPLMRWLCRLVTPPGGTILDPFLGSGSTLKAAKLEGFGGIGIDISSDYLAIADRRIAHVQPALAGLA